MTSQKLRDSQFQNLTKVGAPRARAAWGELSQVLHVRPGSGRVKKGPNPLPARSSERLHTTTHRVLEEVTALGLSARGWGGDTIQRSHWCSLGDTKPSGHRLMRWHPRKPSRIKKTPPPTQASKRSHEQLPGKLAHKKTITTETKKYSSWSKSSRNK